MGEHDRVAREGVPPIEDKKGRSAGPTKYDVLNRFGRLLFTGTLAECYEAYPTLACHKIGQLTSRGLSLLIHGEY